MCFGDGFWKKACASELRLGTLGMVIARLRTIKLNKRPKSDVSEFIIETKTGVVSVSPVLGFFFVSNHESSHRVD